MAAAVIGLALAKKKGRNDEEIKYLESAFNSADVNNDGKVDIREYIAILESRDIYMQKDEIIEMFKNADKDGDLSLSKDEVKDELDRLRDVDTAFKRMDLNKDRKVDSWEMSNATKLNEKQAKAAVKMSDKDKDGVLNKTEFCSMMNKNRNPEVQRGDRVFDELDKNKDGFLDSKELSAAMDASKAYLITKSKRVDKNRDGKLDRQEYRDFVSGAYKRK